MDDTIREGVLEEWDPVKKIGAICTNDQPDYLIEIDETSIATEPKDNMKYLSAGAKVFFFFAFGVPIKVTAEREGDE